MLRPRIPPVASLLAKPWFGGNGSRRGMSALQRASVPTAKELPSYVLNCPETQVTTLPNGLRVASEVRTRIPGIPYSSVGCCLVRIV